MIPSLRLLCLLALACAPALAQESRKPTCRIIFLNGPDQAPNELHLYDGATSQLVELPRMNLSPVYEFRPGARALTLLPNAVEDPEAVPEGAPTVTLPAGVVDLYLVVTSDPSNKVAPVKLEVINANADRLRRGQMLWLNLSPHLVGGQVGSQKLVVKPRSRAVIDPPAARNENYPVNLSFKIAGKEHTYPLCETTWLHDPRSRSIAFIVTKKGVRTPRVWVFPDFRLPKEEEGE